MRVTRAVTVGVALVALVACGDDDDTTAEPPSSTVTEPPSTASPTTTEAPSPTTTEAPSTTTSRPDGTGDDAAVVTWGAAGVRVVGGEATRVVTEQPAEVAVLLASGTVAWQAEADEAASPRPITVVTADGATSTIDPEPGYRLVLHDGATLAGEDALLAATSVFRPAGPDDADSRLVRIDPATGATTDLGMFGGWESAVVQACFADGALSVLMAGEGQNWLVVADPDGSERYQIELEPGAADHRLVVEDPGDAVLVYRAPDGGSTGPVPGFRLALASGQVTDGIEITPVPAGEDPEGPSYR